MAKFKKGDIVIIKSPTCPEYNGIETEILDSFIWIDGERAHHCTIQYDSGGWYESSLRKKKPPEEKIDWVKMCNLDKLPEIA